MTVIYRTLKVRAYLGHRYLLTSFLAVKTYDNRKTYKIGMLMKALGAALRVKSAGGLKLARFSFVERASA